MNDVAQRLASLTPAQRALLQKRLEEKPDVSQPIAIVGMSCRLAGAENTDAYWNLIKTGQSAIKEVPADRWDADEFYDPNPDAPGKMATRWGAFVPNVDMFDSMFFGIAPREARQMDPQQRLLLEVSWEALENAGIAPERLAGSLTGVFVGIGGTDYSKIPTQLADYYERMDPHVGTGNALSIAANRLSYILDFRGPSVAVDTACSSGMVALHLAIQSLRTGESKTAIAGAVNLILMPDVSIAFSKARMLSPTGECRPFDEAANGYVRGEGCGMLVLKPLVDATRDGDDVIAVIRGSAVNQDGRTSGITAPNALSQQACIRSAHASAGISANEVTYVEAHGTGTPLGDPIEFQSLAKVFPRTGPTDPTCFVTSAKAIVGHTETVSGIAGVIKVALMMKHQWIPAQPLLTNVNSNIDLTGTRLEIPREGVSWDVAKSRIAGISSFGFGGTNSHVVMEDVRRPADSAQTLPSDRPQHILAVSARTKSALPKVAGQLRDRLSDLSDADLASFCYSANVGRSHFNHRVGAVATSRKQLLEQLDAIANEKRAKGAKKGDVKIAIKPKIGFLFTGQGSQYADMGKQLYEQHPAFREAMDACESAFYDARGESLLSIVYPGEGGDTERIHQTEFTQPALFALEYSLAQLWRSWGIEPSVMLGHSVGEYVAACVAGVFSADEGMRLIAKRAELMQSLPAGGKMAVIFAKRDRVAEVIAPFGEQIAVATANGPENNAVSGVAEVVDQVVERFENEGIGTVALSVSHAFHSPLMDPILDEFEQFAKGIDFQRPRIPIVANRSGKLVDTAEFTAAYWRDHIRNAVEFEQGVNCLAEQDLTVLLEIGPTAALLGMGRRCRSDMEVAWVPSLRKGKDNWNTLLTAVVELYVAGCRVDWAALDAIWPRKRISLPTYPFERTRMWFEGVGDENGSSGIGSVRGKSVHPLLGARLTTALDMTMMENRLSTDSPAYLNDHIVQGSTVVPGAAYIEQGLAMARQIFGPGAHAVENLSIQQALFLPTEGHRVVQIVAGAESGGRATFDVFSIASDTTDASTLWNLHATGRVVHADAVSGAAQPSFDLETIRGRRVNQRTRDEFYELMDDRNLSYGSSFRVLGASETQNDGMLSELQIPESVVAELGKYHLHPSIGDACLQCTAGAVPVEADNSFSPYTYMPMGVEQVRFWGALADAKYCYAIRTSKDNSPSPENVTVNVSVLDEAGNALVQLIGVSIMRIGSANRGTSNNVEDWLYQITWESQELDGPPEPRLNGNYILLADSDGVANALTEKLQDAGATVFSAVPGDEFTIPASPNDPFTLRPASDADFAALLRETCGTDNAQCAGIVHLWGLRTSHPDSNSDALASARDLCCASVLRLFQQTARASLAANPSIWLVTQDAQSIGESDAHHGAAIQQAPTWGLGRVAAMEHPELACRLIDLDSADARRNADLLFVDLCRPGNENQIAYDGGQRYVARLQTHGQGTADSNGRLHVPSDGSFQLRIVDTGSFDSLRYKPYVPPEPINNQVEIEVAATGLNFSDVLKAMGLYPGITDAIVPIGIECSGIVTRVGADVERFQPGDAVMGVAPYAFGSHTTTSDYALVPKPDLLDHEEASTVPITFMTAYYGLRRLADVQPGERVLIHAGAGGVGLAAIQICQQIGDVEIFATAGSDEKRDFLRSLGVHHVMNSRTLDFADEILEITNREGVDIVLNSLPGDAIPKSLSILRAYGRFLEIGKTDIYQNSMIGLAPFQDNLSYFAIDLDRMLRQRPDYILDLFAEVMTHFDSGAYKSLPLTRFSAGETVDAFRYMAQRKNIGKVVVAMNDRPVATGSADPDSTSLVATIDENGTYLVTGGLGALGMRVAEWLIEQGARYIALMSRRKPQGEAADRLTAWNEQGTHAIAVQGDVADRVSLDGGLDQIPGEFPPLKGVIHAAGVLADGVMFDMELDQLDRPLGPKVQGTWNLHAATQDHALDFFVLFSSVACVLGSPGQSNYAAANAFLDALATSRSKQGKPGLSVNWGPWADSGMAAEAGRDDLLAARGMGLLAGDKALQAMEMLMTTRASNAAVMSVNWTDLLKASGSRSVPPLLTNVAANVEVGGSADSAEDHAFRASLAETDVDGRKTMLNDYFGNQLATIMGLEPEDIDVTQPLNTLGLDSLMAIELKNKIENRLQLTLPMALFMKEPSVSTLANHVAENFGREPAEESSSHDSMAEASAAQVSASP